ncbi:SDH family Clp fold serine proteinase [Pelagibius litoralis]|uniref:SDH family Clp fold serine proteinase n=1 Tax=Pelagibius litoralis TaxID=374515 RepID=UPI001980DDD8|nr:hypothetical protein [Pelagibius litoralis]
MSTEESKERFPRGRELPTQSPLFWVGQKDRYLRQILIRDIEATTGRRLIVWFANRLKPEANIDAGDPVYLTELFGDVGDEPVDLMLETNGGSTDSTEAVVSLIQSLSSDFRVVVANAAKSNGTLICLAAKGIVMGPPSELGPIDPQINGVPCTIWSMPEVAQPNFALQQLAIRALQQSKKLASALLTTGMMNGKDPQHIAEVVEKLATGNTYFSHGSAIDHREASQLGLNVEHLQSEDELWQRIWLLYCMYEHDVRAAEYLKVFEGRSRSLAVSASL